SSIPSWVILIPLDSLRVSLGVCLTISPRKPTSDLKRPVSILTTFDGVVALHSTTLQIKIIAHHAESQARTHASLWLRTSLSSFHKLSTAALSTPACSLSEMT
ncbi:hypothetical protein FPV67DRAFT_1505132, partial [Lyophyllum atratum]